MVPITFQQHRYNIVNYYAESGASEPAHIANNTAVAGILKKLKGEIIMTGDFNTASDTLHEKGWSARGQPIVVPLSLNRTLDPLMEAGLEYWQLANPEKSDAAITHEQTARGGGR